MFVLASNHFWKCFSVNVGVWLRMENKFFRKYFQLTVCFNGFDPEISFSQNFHLKQFPDSRAKRERERERERERGRRESPDHATNPKPRSRLRIRRSTNPRTDLWPRAFDPPIYEPMNWSLTQSLRPTSLRLHRWPRAFAPRTHEPISLYVILIFCVILIDPRTDLRFCVILIFYFLSLISDFVVVVVVVWVVVFWWFSCWVMVENSIFRMLPNTWKYFLEQFS